MYRIVCETGSVLRSTLPSHKPETKFLVCYEATQLAIQLHQERIQVVRSNRKAQKRPLKESSSSSWLKINRVQDRDWRSTKRYERSNANERPTRPWRLSAKSGSCIVQRPVVDHWFLYWRPYRDWYNEGQSGVSVLTVINTATMFASLCVALLYRTCTLFGCAPMSRTLIELCISTPLLWGVGASPSFFLSRSTATQVQDSRG